ncbi:hypothetical protein [Reichenbachiella sp. MALMAid0571]|uniref:hypothetical protein n=1 Tax=Reichenbachiella sp. MALMAid0571 TaxID=3143939 RepID=UPI0032DE5908
MSGIKHLKWIPKLLLVAVILVISGFHFASGTETKIEPDDKKALDEERVFIIHAPITDLVEFRELAKQASLLKPYGQVEINISTLADKSFYEIPEGRNFWYEYASRNPTPYKFFPDPKIAPYIPVDFVKKNRESLLAKAKILREMGLGAAFWSYEPNFLPVAFFDKYPDMLGPRVDHPRRNNQPAFAPCISVEETREMYQSMVAELLKNVPEIKTFFFKTNDAGSGICWSDWQYVGPNGPSHCKHKSMGERVALLMNTFQEGAKAAGNEISIYLTGSMFSDEEKKDIYSHLPENCYYQSHNSDKVKAVSSLAVSHFPVKGMLDPLAFLRSIKSIDEEKNKTIFISFRASYDRGYERLDTSGKFLEMFVKYLSVEIGEGEVNEIKALQQICLEWAGEQYSEILLKGILALEEANKYKSDVLGRISAIYWSVSSRHVTRPLVFAPDLLKKEEESYFMPYVFNPTEDEARMDYTDIHGGHADIQDGVVQKYLSKLNKAIGLLEKVGAEAPEKISIQNLATGLSIYGSFIRSAGNFAEAQVIRERSADKVKTGPHRPGKSGDWTGDPDLQSFNAVMRDELDNAQTLINILENGGMGFINHAKSPEYEDTFLLGPDLIDQLKLKRKIMLRHWIDIESYLTTPFK